MRRHTVPAYQLYTHDGPYTLPAIYQLQYWPLRRFYIKILFSYYFSLVQYYFYNWKGFFTCSNACICVIIAVRPRFSPLIMCKIISYLYNNININFNCNWVLTQWQWLFYMYTNMEKEVTRKFKSGGLRERHVVATWKLGNHLSIRL